MSKGTKVIRLGRVERMMQEVATLRRFAEHQSKEHEEGFERAMNYIYEIARDHFPELETDARNTRDARR